MKTDAGTCHIDKLEYSAEDGILRKIVLDDGRIIQPSGWGVECTNWYSFFSQEKMGGLNVKIQDVELLYCNCDGIKMSIKVIFRHGRFKIDVSEKLINGNLRRTYRITALNNSLFGDFVLRSKFIAKKGSVAYSIPTVFIHGDNNLNYYLPPEPSYISANEYLFFTSNVNFLSNRSYPYLLKTMYLRDEPGFWRIHYRYLSCDEPFLRGWGKHTIVSLKYIERKTSFLKPSLENPYFMGRERNYWLPLKRWQLVANSRVTAGDYFQIQATHQFLPLAEAGEIFGTKSV